MNAKTAARYLPFVFIASLCLALYIARYASNWLTNSSQDLRTLRSEVSALETQQSNLELAKKVLLEQKQTQATLADVLPDDKAQARLLREIESIARGAGVTIESITFPSSTLGTATRTPAPATTDTQAQATSPAPTAAVSQATPVKEIPGVQSIQLTLGTIRSKDGTSSDIRFEEMMALVRLLERNRRTLQITSIGIDQASTSAVTGETRYNLSLSLVTFIEP